MKGEIEQTRVSWLVIAPLMIYYQEQKKALKESPCLKLMGWGK